MDHAIEKSELRELTDLEIDNVDGGNVGIIVFCATAIFVVGFMHGYTTAKEHNIQ
jgi:hypothetical protein